MGSVSRLSKMKDSFIDMADIFGVGFSPELERTGGMLQPTLGAFSGALPGVVEDELHPQVLSAGATTQLLFSAKETFTATENGFRMGLDPTDDSYKWVIGTGSSSADWNVTTANTFTINGAITATTGTIGGFSIGSDFIRDAANSMGMASTVTGSDDVRFWAGDTYANRATAPFRVLESGALRASDVNLSGGTISVTTVTATLQNTTSTSTNRIRIQGTGTGADPVQTALSLAVMEGGSNIMEIKGGAGAVDDPIINFTPTTDSGQTFLKASTAATVTTGGMVNLAATASGGGVTLMKLTNSGTGANSICLTISSSSTTNPPIIAVGAVISTNFRRILKGNAATIWESNGTTPNGNLSGTAGDICLNGDSGNIYRCSVTGTTWVAM